MFLRYLNICPNFFGLIVKWLDQKAKFISTRGLETLSLPYTLDDFWRTIFLTIYFTSWPNFIVWMPLLFGILDNICIAIVCFPVDDVKIFDRNLSFITNLFSKVLGKFTIFDLKLMWYSLLGIMKLELSVSFT